MEKTVSEKQRVFTLMVAQIILFAYARGYELTCGTVREDGLSINFGLWVDGEETIDREKFAPIAEKWEALGGVYIPAGELAMCYI